jgi:hypothetical protein
MLVLIARVVVMGPSVVRESSLHFRLRVASRRKLCPCRTWHDHPWGLASQELSVREEFPVLKSLHVLGIMMFGHFEVSDIDNEGVKR